MDRSRKKFYAAPSYLKDVELSEVAQEISKLCTLTPVDVIAVLESFVATLPRYLKEGRPVKMGNLGRLKPSFKSEGRDKEEEVTSDVIKSEKILFTPSSQLKREMETVTYEKR